MASFKKWFAGLTANTFLLALASFFADVSTEMLYPVLPVFLTETLGARANIVGIVEGIATAVQYIIQGFSGWLSDKFQRRKPIALFGYALAAAAKPLIGLASAWPGVLAARSIDRLGSGTRSAPRDALVAASADEAHRGKAFGLEGIGDNLGACLGPLITIALLGLLQMNLRWIFYLALIPGVLATLMILSVHEGPVSAAAKAKVDMHLHGTPSGYWKYLAVTALFGLGNSSNSFLILRTSDLGAGLTTTIFIYALYNLVAALVSYPAGYLADHLGRKGILLFAFVLYAGVYAGFGWSTNVLLIGVLFVLYGVFQGIFRAVGKVLASDFVPQELRAGAIGWYMATVGLSGLAASVIAGELWTRVSPSAAFLFGAAMALAGSIALVLVNPKHGTS